MSADSYQSASAVVGVVNRTDGNDDHSSNTNDNEQCKRSTSTNDDDHRKNTIDKHHASQNNCSINNSHVNSDNCKEIVSGVTASASQSISILSYPTDAAGFTGSFENFIDMTSFVSITSSLTSEELQQRLFQVIKENKLLKGELHNRPVRKF